MTAGCNLVYFIMRWTRAELPGDHGAYAMKLLQCTCEDSGPDPVIKFEKINLFQMAVPVMKRPHVFLHASWQRRCVFANWTKFRDSRAQWPHSSLKVIRLFSFCLFAKTFVQCPVWMPPLRLRCVSVALHATRPLSRLRSWSSAPGERHRLQLCLFLFGVDGSVDILISQWDCSI